MDVAAFLANPLAALGSMPSAPKGWETMAVVQPQEGRQPGPGERWPLTFYQVIGVAEINQALGWGPYR